MKCGNVAVIFFEANQLDSFLKNTKFISVDMSDFFVEIIRNANSTRYLTSEYFKNLTENVVL